MNGQKIIWAGLFVGSLIGGFIPGLWGASEFSASGIVFSALGGIAGIYAGYRIAQY